MGGSLSRNRDLLERHADLSPRLHFIRYHGTLMVGEIPGDVVGTSQISKSVGREKILGGSLSVPSLYLGVILTRQRQLSRVGV